MQPLTHPGDGRPARRRGRRPGLLLVGVATVAGVWGGLAAPEVSPDGTPEALRGGTSLTAEETVQAEPAPPRVPPTPTPTPTLAPAPVAEPSPGPSTEPTAEPTAGPVAPATPPAEAVQPVAPPVVEPVPMAERTAEPLPMVEPMVAR